MEYLSWHRFVLILWLSEIEKVAVFRKDTVGLSTKQIHQGKLFVEKYVEFMKFNKGYF